MQTNREAVLREAARRPSRRLRRQSQRQHAFIELCELGIVTAESVMVPCPRFPEMAAVCRDRPDLDVGVT
ncbi:ChbG/HpnK family deacetylase [Rhizobium leguminosarum]|uniref:ChbG/HpnK family deacetylase n=1 Tax=Rhizobium leguminosarum TaxID=384 RepID=UPI003CCB5A12